MLETWKVETKYCVRIVGNCQSTLCNIPHEGIAHFCRVGNLKPVAYPGILFGGGGGSTNSVEDRENGNLGALAS